jgi:ubiquinone/menaquinone biosynthesis C-methylase UbiE/pimeloyl-ACP methyl ester carboxylesterase
VVSGPEFEPEATVTNLSVEGAFVRTRREVPIGTRFQFKIELPTPGVKPIRVGGKVVRLANDGIGIKFEDIASRDRSRIREYARFAEMDDTIVKVQRRMDDVLTGNLLPVSDREAIEQRLRQAAHLRLKALVVDPARNSEPIWAHVGYDREGLRLHGMEHQLRDDLRVVYIVVFDGPMHFMFEGLLADSGPNPHILEPERMYHNERRAGAREMVQDTWIELDAPHLGEPIRLPIIDISERGCSVRTLRTALVAPGMRFPAFQISRRDSYEPHDGATIRRVVPAGAESFLVGLNFADDINERDTFSEIHSRNVKSSIWVNLGRLTSVAKQKIRGLVKPKHQITSENIVVARYKNERGEHIGALLDASFDLRAETPAVDLAVVIAPAFLRRKEVFSLLARTLVDNFKAANINAVVLRFDATHTVGESAVDPELEAQGNPYLRWTFSHLESDIKASILHVERRFHPKKRVLITFSVAAMAARRYIADGNKPTVDHWIAPFGCPDAQDMFQNYLAGIDLFELYKKGQKAEPFLIYGRLADPSFVFTDAMKRGMAFLEDARKDIEKIKIPVTWIIGTYDYMVTRERVRQMLNAPGGGVRQAYEMPTGHVAKAGDEAIESFKLIAESVFKNVFDDDREAIEPDMGRFIQQDEAEWARIKQSGGLDAQAFWERHLFGTGDSREGYDVLLYNPDYVEFLRHQAMLLDIREGDQVADIGCGTGNFSRVMMEVLPTLTKPFSLTCMDLVPEAIRVTGRKLEKVLADEPIRPEIKTRVMDLEGARLRVLQEFLSGELYGVRGFEGRLEGLHAGTIRHIGENHGPQLHRILRGEAASLTSLRNLLPDFEDDDLEMVEELSRASRFVMNRILPEDVKPGETYDGSVKTLKFRHLCLDKARQQCRLDIEDNSFDKLGSSLVVSYIYDPLSVIKEYYRILKPGGIAVISSLKQNFDASKSYLEEAKTIAESADLGDLERARLLDSLREFASFVGCVMELEDEGRFKFFTNEQFASIMRDAGFVDVQLTESFGRPATAVIVKAIKPNNE